MLDNLFNPQIDNLQRGLTRATQRQSLLMTNLANINVPGYKRKDLDFNITLQDEMQGGGSKEEPAVVESSNTSLRPDNNNVDMEQEVMSISETELRFQALTDFTANYFSNLKNAIREGR
jgi:flagellar basal-body rod protein FlgB